MIDILHSEEYRTASDTATIKVQRYIDSGFGAWVIWRITIRRDRDELGRILEQRLLRRPSDSKIKRIIARY